MKNNILLSGLLLSLTVVFLSSCKKEKISPTQAEKTASELMSVIKRNKITRVYPVRIDQPLPTPFSASGGTGWTFSNGFIYINNSSYYDGYNLSYLVRYGINNVSLSNGSSEIVLLLYMEQ
jgi:hypothetical protein